MTLWDDLRIKQGETWRRTYPLYDAAGAPADLTSAIVRGQIRATRGSGTALHSWSNQDDSVTLEPGQITLHVPAAVSSAWTWTAGRWDLELTDASGDTVRVVEGVVLVDPETTRT